MPRQDRREYSRKYQTAWIKARRGSWIIEHGPCVKCGSSEDLEVDHQDPSLKKLNPRNLWSMKRERRDLELAKCQVLCRDCHQIKTSAEQALRNAIRRPGLPHGTQGGYRRGCRCDQCQEGYSRARKRQRMARNLMEGARAEP